MSLVDGKKGINIPDIERLMNLAVLGNVTVTYILYGDTFSSMLKLGTKISKFENWTQLEWG